LDRLIVMKIRRRIIFALLFLAAVANAQPAQRLRDLANYLQLTPNYVTQR